MATVHEREEIVGEGAATVDFVPPYLATSTPAGQLLSALTVGLPGKCGE